MQCGRFRTVICNTDLNKQVFRRLLRVFHKDIKVAIFIEDPGVQQFILHIATVAALVRLDQIDVGKGTLRILVQILHVGMRRRAIKIEVIFLNIFSVVGFTVRQTEHSFLENGILAIPKRDTEAELLFVVADSGEAVFTPVIRPRASLIVSEIVPGITILAIVLANSTPLPLAQIWAPLSPHGLFEVRASLVWLTPDPGALLTPPHRSFGGGFPNSWHRPDAYIGSIAVTRADSEFTATLALAMCVTA